MSTGSWPGRLRILVAFVGLAGAERAAAIDLGTLSEYVTPTFSERLRGEFTDWFRPPPGTADAGAQRYSSLASQLRAGVRVTLPRVQLVVEMQDTRLVGLPD